MKDFKGIIKIMCDRGRKPCPRKIAGNDVQIECVECPLSVRKMINLEGQTLYRFPDYEPEKKQKQKSKGGMTDGI